MEKYLFKITDFYLEDSCFSVPAAAFFSEKEISEIEKKDGEIFSFKNLTPKFKKILENRKKIFYEKIDKILKSNFDLPKNLKTLENSAGKFKITKKGGVDFFDFQSVEKVRALVFAEI